jgi:hypothetical protein
MPTQRPPAWQTPPAQHAPATAPQAWQVRGMPLPGFAQPRPVLHVLFAQQPSLSAPHGSHVCEMPPSVTAVWQVNPAVQALPPPPEQQAAPFAPQATQLPPVQRAPDAVQVMPPPPPPVVQHSCPTAPQALPPGAHEPFVHMPSWPPHVAPDA